jgi:hypothetical protein
MIEGSQGTAAVQEPDGRLLEFLHHELTRHGYDVFLDRHLTIGVEWAREIKARIRSSDAVIVLLSAASIQSEMVTCEVEIAHEAAQQHGKPALLPVRVAYAGPLSEPLARILGPRQQTAWEGSADDRRLLDQLLHALENPPEHRPGAAGLRLEPVGGAVPLESQFYIVRPVDEDFRASIARQDGSVLVKGAQADRDEGIFGDHLRRILVLLAKDQELPEVVRDLLRGRPGPTPESFYRLRTAGLGGGDSAQDARPRCQLYETYLKRPLL